LPAVGGRRLTAKYVPLATGSSPAVPEIPGLAAAGVLTNEDVFPLDRLPARLAVLGGGPVGAELAQALARLGSEVTVLTRAVGLLPREDPELVALLTERFAAEGIGLETRVKVTAIRRDGGELVVTVGDRPELRVDQILAATGRRPNVAGLGLAVTGVVHGPGGVPVDDRLRTNVAHILAAGDVTGGPAYTHFAGYQAAHAVRNIVVPGSPAFDPGAVPAVTFTDPEIARVGQAENGLRDSGTAYDVVRLPYARHERTLTDGDRAGQDPGWPRPADSRRRRGRAQRRRTHRRAHPGHEPQADRRPPRQLDPRLPDVLLRSADCPARVRHRPTPRPSPAAGPTAGPLHLTPHPEAPRTARAAD